MSRPGLSPSYLGCGRLTTEGYGGARRERVHGLHQFLMSMSVGRYHCIAMGGRQETPILPAPVIREKSQFRAQHDSLSLSPRS